MAIASSETGAATRAGVMAQGQRPVRAMIVDDSVVVRSLLRRWLTEDGVEVVSVHRTGREAVDAMHASDPDVVILDIEMPDMDGVTALPIILERQPGVAVLMASTLTRRNAEISVRCLSMGASDFLSKPDVTRDSSGTDDFRAELLAKVRVLGNRMRARVPRRQPRNRSTASVSLSGWAGHTPPSISLRSVSRTRPRVLAIGSSTGGPQALAEVFRALKGHQISVPIFVTQHMPPNFTAVLADHVRLSSGMPACEAEHGTPAVPGHIYVAPGGFHMVVGGSAAKPVIEINTDPPVNFCRPAVDPLFASLAALYGPAVLAAVLTGMGSDGAQGGLTIADAGGTVIAQDEASSVVWGMPGQTVQVGASAAILPIAEIGPRILSLLSGAAA